MATYPSTRGSPLGHQEGWGAQFPSSLSPVSMPNAKQLQQNGCFVSLHFHHFQWPPLTHGRPSGRAMGKAEMPMVYPTSVAIPHHCLRSPPAGSPVTQATQQEATASVEVLAPGQGEWHAGLGLPLNGTVSVTWEFVVNLLYCQSWLKNNSPGGGA